MHIDVKQEEKKRKKTQSKFQWLFGTRLICPMIFRESGPGPSSEWAVKWMIQNITRYHCVGGSDTSHRISLMINQTPLATTKLYFRDYCYWISFFHHDLRPPIHESANVVRGYYSTRRIQGSDKHLRASMENPFTMDEVALSMDADSPRMACSIYRRKTWKKKKRKK